MGGWGRASQLPGFVLSHLYVLLKVCGWIVIMVMGEKKIRSYNLIYQILEKEEKRHKET